MSAEAEADVGPMSIDDAAALLDAADEPIEQLGDDAPLSEGEPTPEDDLPPDEVTEDETEDEPDPATVIAAPQSWDAEARAIWQTIPPEAQQVIAARDAESSATVQRALNEKTEVTRQANQQIESVTQLRAATEAVLRKAAQTFQGKWDNVDWLTWAQTDPAAYTAGKAMFEAEQSELGRLDAVTQHQTNLAMQHFQTTKVERLKTLAPELLDPVKGPALVQELEANIVAMGVDRSILHTLDADVIALARDGFRWRAAQKSRPTSPQANKSAPAPARAAVRPTAAAAVRTPQRAHEEARQRLRTSGSIDDAVRLLDSRQR